MLLSFIQHISKLFIAFGASFIVPKLPGAKQSMVKLICERIDVKQSIECHTEHTERVPTLLVFTRILLLLRARPKAERVFAEYDNFLKLSDPTDRP